MDAREVEALTSLDDVIQDIGPCGMFQVLMLLAFHSTIAAAVGGMMMMAFGSYNPGWECLDLTTGATEGNASDTTYDGVSILSTTIIPRINQSDSDSTTDRCMIYSTCKNVLFHPGASTIASEWGLVCDRAWALKVILTVQMVGVLVGAYLVGHMGDCIGRKGGLYVMVVIHALSNLVAVFSPSWQVFAAIRFFIGVGSGGILTPAYITPLEFTGQLWRSVITAIPTWSVCTSLFAVFVLLLKDWRQLHLLYAGISCLVLLPAFWVPESFRWLAVRGRDKDASEVANRIAELNKRPMPSLDVLVNMAESERRRASEERSGRYGFLDLFRIAFIRKQTFIMGYVYFIISFVYFAISFNVQALSGDFYINFLILSVMKIPNAIISLPTNSFLSRRVGSFIHFLIVSMACFGITIVSLAIKSTPEDENGSSDNTLKSNFNVALAVIAKVGLVCGWNASNLFCAELFPTVVRNMAFGYLITLARVGSLMGSALFPEDPAFLYLAMLVLGALVLISAGLFLILPETKGAPLEDMFRHNTISLEGEGHCMNGKATVKCGDENEQNDEEHFQSTGLL